MTMAMTLPYDRSDANWDIEEDESQRAGKLTSLAGRLWRDSGPLRDEMVRTARMYDNTPILGVGPRLATTARGAYGVSLRRARRCPINVVKSVVDTYCALVTEDQPKLSFVTTGGDWALQQRAAKLEKFVDGVFYDNSMYQTALQCARDSALFQFGVAKVFPDESDPEQPRVAIERVIPWEVLFDDDEAMYGKPSRMYQVRFVEKRALCDDYPDLADKIMLEAGLEGFDDVVTALTDSVAVEDWCAVVEGWSLPRGKREGRWTQAVGRLQLDDRPHTRRTFPFKFLWKNDPLAGLRATSLAQDLAPLQVQIAKLTALVERSIFTVVGHWLVEQNSEVNTNALDNVVASVIKYKGIPPSFQAGRPLDASVFSYLANLVSKAYELTGVSESAAQSKKPANLSSGKAQLVYAEAVSRRFTPCYRRYQNWFLELAQESIHQGADIAERHPNFSIKTVSQSMQQTVKWGDAHLRDEEYTLQLFPTNKLADDPAARLAEVQALINAKMISEDDGRRLLEMPDLQNLYSLQDSAYNLVMQTVEMILEHGEYSPPSKFFGDDQLLMGLSQMRMCYWKATLQKVPPEKLAMMQSWMDQAAAMLSPPPPEEGPPDEGPPPEGPGPAGVEGAEEAMPPPAP